MYVVATAGHVDHGKSTLVAALTGIDPDRLAEEKRRGLTIDLGFAAMTLPSGRAISFVDVPGHVNFIENMLAGVGVLRECLFVVAATEGWKPQSEEHLRILELFAFSRGVIALTKVDLVDDVVRARVRGEVVRAVEGTFLEGAPIIETDAVHGLGLQALTLALDKVVETESLAEGRGRPRLWVDRSFSIRGAGTVVTGTLTGGSLHEHDLIDLVATGTGRDCAQVRVRSLQVHNGDVDRATPGHRVAVNLAGIEHHAVRRGQALVRREQWVLTTTIDASLRVLSSLDHNVTRRGAYQAYVGSAHHRVKLRVLGDAAIVPGESGLVRLHLPVELPLLMGDRFVLRESGRSETVGGGEVLDVEPMLPAAKARPDASVDRLIAERGWVLVEHLEKLTGERVRANVGEWCVDPRTLGESTRRLRLKVDEAGDLGLDLRTIDAHERALLDEMNELAVDGNRIRVVKDDAHDPIANHPYVALLESALFSPPSPVEARVSKVELDELVRRGSILKWEDLYFAASAMTRASEVVAQVLAQHPDGVSASQVRERLGTTRKFALPILRFLDANGVTRRRGDLRIAGPRLPSLHDQST